MVAKAEDRQRGRRLELLERTLGLAVSQKRENAIVDLGNRRLELGLHGVEAMRGMDSDVFDRDRATIDCLICHVKLLLVRWEGRHPAGRRPERCQASGRRCPTAVSMRRASSRSLASLPCAPSIS